MPPPTCSRAGAAGGAVLALVELSSQARRYPHQLSGGQQQRVALARAIAYPPAVLLLDEPFSNLDAKLRERARDWLKELQHTLGLTTIFVTHDQDEALSMSDRILVMDGGRILRDASPEETYRQPRVRFVADFLGRCNFLTGAVTAGPDDSSVVKTAEFADPITVQGARPDRHHRRPARRHRDQPARRTRQRHTGNGAGCLLSR